MSTWRAIRGNPPKVGIGQNYRLQSGWYAAFERINNDGSVSHWFINQDGQHNNYIFPKQQLEAHLKRLGVNLNNVIITHELRDQIAQMRQKPPNTSVALEGGINSKL